MITPEYQQTPQYENSFTNPFEQIPQNGFGFANLNNAGEEGFKPQTLS
jgi:hypothetical protein